MENNNNGYSRHVSRLTRETMALVLAGGQGSRLHELTEWRAKPALHFGGKYRIIDFPLSNCINSGVRRGWQYFNEFPRSGLKPRPAVNQMAYQRMRFVLG